MLAGCGAAQHPRPTDGAIAGLARDHDSGDPVAKAEIRIRANGELAPRATISTPKGGFAIDHLPPGLYSLSASFAGQPVDVENIVVRVGEVTIVDVVFTLGRPNPVHVDFGDPGSSAIERYRPTHHALDTSLIEGTVNDVGDHTRIAGAVVTVVGGPNDATLQVVSDDQGRYRLDPVPPGTYMVSAYYSVSGHAEMEIRRSEIRVAAAEAVVVPLWIEIARQ